MKRFILAIAVLAVGAVAVNAQGGPPGGPGGFKPSPEMMKKFAAQREARHQKMIKDLALTPAQAKKEAALWKAYNDKQAKLMKQPGDFMAKREPMMKLRKGYNDDLKKLLSKTQVAKLEKIQEEQRKARGMMGGPGGGMRPGGRMGG